MIYQKFCNNCQGRGYIEIKGGDTKECPTCKGTGKK